MNHSQIPVARKEGLVIQEMPEEVLVYDLDTNKAHCLNKTAAFVWNSCDGKNSVADIKNLLGTRSGDVSDDLVWLAIDQLNKNNLLENDIKANFNGQTRREVIRKIGLASIVALPLISSIVAPPAVSAQSLGICDPGGTGVGNDGNKLANGSACNGNGNCCSNICCSNICSSVTCR
jgi:hypothetical protein